jgi:hypothetical protein
MAVRIPTDQIQNRQQIEAAVAGPDGANRLFTVTGQFDIGLNLFSQGVGQVHQNETFTVLIGPVLTRQQFFRAIGTASLAKTAMFLQSLAPNGFGWSINGTDADWDDESGQVELRVEVSLVASGQNNRALIDGLAFQVTILAAVAA